MLSYQIALAWRSVRKTPALCGLMILALGLGVAMAMVSYTAHHALIQNPLEHKDDRLFSVHIDSWHAKEAFKQGVKSELPPTLSYRDVQAIIRAKQAPRWAAMTSWGGTVSLQDTSRIKPRMAFSKITTRDYFAMFERPFVFGGPWEAAADESLLLQVAISERLNNRLFEGRNSVGESILFEGKVFQVVGVYSDLPERNGHPENVHRGNMTSGDAIFPFGLLEGMEITPWEGMLCPEDTRDYGTGKTARMTGSCNWIGLWVEFDNAQQKAEFENLISRYIDEQKALGFFPREKKFALMNASQRLLDHGYNEGVFSLTFKLGLGILLVCVINSVALLLAKFSRQAQECGVRRAMGASRRAIFNQHLLESGVIGFLGGLAGLLFTYIGLAMLKVSFRMKFPGPIEDMGQNTDALFTPDLHVLLVTLALGIGASVLAGIYPAWRICRTPAALYLKQQ
jgi:putative ABC transport system permease protein